MTAQPLLTRSRRHRRRATVLIEFVMVLPMFFYLTLFTLDVGRLAVAHTMLSDATYIGARSAAQYGRVYTTQGNVVQIAFENALRDMPGMDPAKASSSVTGTTVCRAGAGNSPYITVVGTYDMTFSTPGLQAVLDAANGGGYLVRTKASVLCEVAR